MKLKECKNNESIARFCIPVVDSKSFLRKMCSCFSAVPEQFLVVFFSVQKVKKNHVELPRFALWANEALKLSKRNCKILYSGSTRVIIVLCRQLHVVFFGSFWLFLAKI